MSFSSSAYIQYSNCTNLFAHVHILLLIRQYWWYIEIDVRTERFSCLIGCVQIRKCESSGLLYQYADDALHAAKKRGRNQIFAGDDMDQNREMKWHAEGGVLQ